MTKLKICLFHQRLESLQYNACLATTGPIHNTSKEKLYQELVLESLKLDMFMKNWSIFEKNVTRPKTVDFSLIIEILSKFSGPNSWHG